MTSNRKAKKQPSPIEANRLINRQFYRRMEVMDYPDIIHVKTVGDIIGLVEKYQK